jgi:hypothetical protein
MSNGISWKPLAGYLGFAVLRRAQQYKPVELLADDGIECTADFPMDATIGPAVGRVAGKVN